MTTPAYDPGRCINCGGPISDDYPPAAGCCHQSECWGPGTGPGTRRAGLPPDCPHGLYRGDWCDDCGTEVPYPSEVNGPDDDSGLVPSFDGTTWRLHGGPDGRIVWEGTL